MAPPCPAARPVRTDLAMSPAACLGGPCGCRHEAAARSPGRQIGEFIRAGDRVATVRTAMRGRVVRWASEGSSDPRGPRRAGSHRGCGRRTGGRQRPGPEGAVAIGGAPGASSGERGAGRNRRSSSSIGHRLRSHETETGPGRVGPLDRSPRRPGCGRRNPGLRASVRRHRRAQGGSPMLRSIRPKRATLS